MEKICRGCFGEWDVDYEKCPNCGWHPNSKPSKMFGWETGDVIDKRYLVGKTFCITRQKDAAIFRLYDNLLGICCFGFLLSDDDENKLKDVSDSIKKAQNGKQDVVVLSLKRMGKHSVLIMSFRDKFMDINEFQKLTVLMDEKEDSEIPDPIDDNEREQVLPPGTCLQDRYRIIDCIGIGGFGITYLCEDIMLRRLCALKEYFPAEWAERDGEYVAVKMSKMLQPYKYGLQSFLKEIKITAKFIHTPHMVTIFEAFEANDTAYLVMDYILGISMGRTMRTRGYEPYSGNEVAKMMYPVMDALEEMHDKKIIHSDISPGNIMATEQGEMYLIDLGAAKYNLQSQPPISAAFLKIDYAAPEQYRTAKEGKPGSEGPWTDIFALGATMYYLLTGEKPTDVIRRLNGEDTDLTEGLKDKVSDEWLHLLQDSMRLEPSERISSIPKLREAVKSVCGEG